jgi:hypothetical protein
MNTVQEIEAAIRSLAPQQREQLAKDLPALLPELDGDAAWEKIIRDARPRPAFSAFIGQAEDECRNNPNAFPEIQGGDFERHS